jgi:exonuclease III
MTATLRIVTLNIERSKHLDLVIPFLKRERPDVICLQELSEPDIPRFIEALGVKEYRYVPMTRFPEKHGSVSMGIGIFSQAPIVRSTERLYSGDLKSSASILDITNDKTRFQTQCHMVLVCEVQKGDLLFRIAVTHFPKSEFGDVASDVQRQVIDKFLQELRALGGLVVCGDFNAPRGGEIFARIASEYKDNVPGHYTTSIDGALHRAGQLPYMVDGIFSTPGYVVTNVEMVSGLSDHCALLATVSKN